MRRLVLRNALYLLKPHCRLAIAGGAVITPGRQGAAGTDLRGIRNATALELAELEKAIGKDPQPVLDLANAVLPPLCFRNVGPAALGMVVPATVGQKRNLRWGIS